MKNKKYDNLNEMAQDLGLSPEYALLAELKAKLTKKILERVEKQGLSHKDVSELSNIPGSAITGILSGSLQKLTLDRLVRILGALGNTIDLKVKKVA